LQSFVGLIRLTFLWAVRDRVLHAVFGVGALLLVLVPVLSDFSMRQVQESAISLSLSASSVTLLVVAVLLGAAAVFRDVDRRYTISILGLPLSRTAYILGRFFGIVVFLATTAVFLLLFSSAVIAYSATIYPSAQSVPWGTIIVVFLSMTLKSVVLTALALLFSTISTSFTLPFFSTLGIWIAGSASQEVYEYISGSFGKELPYFLRLIAEVLYYVLPNFSGLNLQLFAIYGLPLSSFDVLVSFLYAVIYTVVIACLAVLIFTRRDLS
jgi:Cu-processing system permease protein